MPASFFLASSVFSFFNFLPLLLIFLPPRSEIVHWPWTNDWELSLSFTQNFLKLKTNWTKSTLLDSTLPKNKPLYATPCVGNSYCVLLSPVIFFPCCSSKAIPNKQLKEKWAIEREIPTLQKSSQRTHEHHWVWNKLLTGHEPTDNLEAISQPMI